jgi:hypothetical protein
MCQGHAPSTGTGALGEDTTLTRPPRNAPVEILPYVRYQCACHHFHPHRFPGRLSGVVGCKEVVVRNGALLHVPVGLVLQELLGHAHRAVALSAEVREENGWCRPQQDHSPAAGLCVLGIRIEENVPQEIEEVTGGLRGKPLVAHTARNCQVTSQEGGRTQAASRVHCPQTALQRLHWHKSGVASCQPKSSLCHVPEVLHTLYPQGHG